MPHVPKKILVFYELYNIPNIYREIMTEIIMNNRLLRKTFNQMLSYTQEKKSQQVFSEWEVLNKY
tara:strand:- start:304 stop:498 length:195 start_codon:yes stop_codon:yes gene_type:complete